MPVSKSRISFLRIFAPFPLRYSSESQPAFDEPVEDGVGGLPKPQAYDVDAAQQISGFQGVHAHFAGVDGCKPRFVGAPHAGGFLAGLEAVPAHVGSFRGHGEFQIVQGDVHVGQRDIGVFAGMSFPKMDLAYEITGVVEHVVDGSEKRNRSSRSNGVVQALANA